VKTTKWRKEAEYLLENTSSAVQYLLSAVGTWASVVSFDR
jgi:hypothetical protein